MYMVLRVNDQKTTQQQILPAEVQLDVEILHSSFVLMN